MLPLWEQTFVIRGSPYLRITAPDSSLIGQVVHGEEPDPFHHLGGRVHQHLLFRAEPGPERRKRPELGPDPPEHPGPEAAARQPLLHRFIPLCGGGLYLRPLREQPHLNPNRV